MDFKHTYIEEANVNIIAVDILFIDNANGTYFKQLINDNHPEMNQFMVALEDADGISFLSSSDGEFFEFDLNGIPKENWVEYTWGKKCQ